MYAEGSAEALHSTFGKNLVGFGSAPEGLENNEVVYELLADMGWTSDKIDLDTWIRQYCLSRYGFCDDKMMQAWQIFHKTVYSNLYSYPRFTWQTVVPDQRRKSMHNIDNEFGRAVKLFLECSDSCSSSPLYLNDAVEFAALWLGEMADRHYEAAISADSGAVAAKELSEAVKILRDTDRILSSHPDYSLNRWVQFARSCASTTELADVYEANAKRLITTWGGWQEDYAARFWAGLIESYYIPRMQIYLSTERDNLDKWEEEWVNTPYICNEKQFDDPLKAIKGLI